MGKLHYTTPQQVVSFTYLISGADGQTHDISIVVSESGDGLSLLNVPVNASGVSTTRDDVTLVDEAAAGQVAVVGGELLRGAHGLGSLELVDGAEVVETSAGDHVVDARFEGAGHDPGRAKGDGLDLWVGGGLGGRGGELA